MKIISKLIIIIISISFFISCSSDNEIEENITKGYWIENITKQDFINVFNESQKKVEIEKGVSNEVSLFLEKLPKEIKHYFVFEDSRFKEYLTIKQDKLVLISDIPALIDGSTLTLLHPDNSGEIISTIEILNGMILGHKTTQSFEFKYSKFDNKNVSRNMLLSHGECLAYCYITHWYLGISSLDDICCFWYF